MTNGAGKLLGVLACAAVAGCGDGMASGEAGRAGAVLGSAEVRAARPGAAFVLGNQAGGNEVLAFARAPDGTLTEAGRFPTGGLGTGAGLGSQGALALSRDGRWLYAVDAGSNDLSLFRVHGAELVRMAHVPTGGVKPVSVTVHGDLAFVVHAGGDGGIAGFVRQGSTLVPAGESVLPLSAPGAEPAQISFSPGGDSLVVTEKATNKLSLYLVDEDGGAQGPWSFQSAGETPFGFQFAGRDLLVVSEAFGGAPGLSTVSSYRLHDGMITAISTASDRGTAACWVVVSRDGRTAYVTNTGSDDVSIYSVDPHGEVTAVTDEATRVPAGPGSAPIDAALTRDGRFLYVLHGGTDELSSFAVAADGMLEKLPGISGLPASAVGLAAR